MNSMEKKDKAVEPEKKKVKLFKVILKKRALTKFGALKVADNPHHVPLNLKKSLEKLGYIG